MISTDNDRMIVLTDIGNEPGDSQFLVRLLTYSNEFEIEKLIAITSTWQRDKVQPALLKNGLNVPEHPEYGGWGGRYASVAYNDEGGLRTSVSDTVQSVDGKEYRNASASIWRFRHQFQNDFAGRMQWTLTDNYQDVNHNPVLTLNGQAGLAPVELSVKAGDKVELSAAGSQDPDGDKLAYRWWQYGEPTAHALQIHFAPKVELTDSDKMTASFVAPKVDKPTPFHIILEVSDDGEPQLYSYRRAIVTVNP
ncbi:nucleoside hydrolase-like domain-containing protein [Vibrio sp. CDRSL-10 TSBA]